MKARDHATLGKALNAADGWRTAAKAAGVDLQEINARFSDGSPIRLQWTQERTESVNPETGVTEYEITWEGWEVRTNEF